MQTSRLQNFSANLMYENPAHAYLECPITMDRGIAIVSHKGTASYGEVQQPISSLRQRLSQ